MVKPLRGFTLAEILNQRQLMQSALSVGKETTKHSISSVKKFRLKLVRFLFSVIDAKSHLNPLIPVAQELENRGHEVHFFSTSDSTKDYLSRMNLKNFLGYLPIFPEAGKMTAEQISSSIINRSIEDHYKIFKKNLVDCCYQSVEKMREVIRAFKPDAILTDPIKYDIAIAAELEKKKWIAISCSLCPVIGPGMKSDLMEAMKLLDDDRKKLLSDFGVKEIEFRGWDCLSPYLTVCFSTPEFIGSHSRGVALVGPSHPPDMREDLTRFPWDKLRNDRPKVLMALGSQVYFQPSYYNKVIEALKGEDIQLILALGDLLNSGKIEPLLPYAIAVDYIPQPSLLKHVDLFISHGGANSVMESLIQGTPMLITPISIDQPHQGWFVEKAGVGKQICIQDASIEEIRESVFSVLNSAQVKKRIKEISRSYQKNGALKAADMIIEVCLGNRAF